MLGRFLRKKDTVGENLDGNQVDPRAPANANHLDDEEEDDDDNKSFLGAMSFFGSASGDDDKTVDTTSTGMLMDQFKNDFLKNMGGLTENVTKQLSSRNLFAGVDAEKQKVEATLDGDSKQSASSSNGLKENPSSVRKTLSDSDDDESDDDESSSAASASASEVDDPASSSTLDSSVSDNSRSENESVDSESVSSPRPTVHSEDASSQNSRAGPAETSEHSYNEASVDHVSSSNHSGSSSASGSDGSWDISETGDASQTSHNQQQSVVQSDDKNHVILGDMLEQPPPTQSGIDVDDLIEVCSIDNSYIDAESSSSMNDNDSKSSRSGQSSVRSNESDSCQNGEASSSQQNEETSSSQQNEEAVDASPLSDPTPEKELPVSPLRRWGLLRGRSQEPDETDEEPAEKVVDNVPSSEVETTEPASENNPNQPALQESPRRRWGLLRGRSNGDDDDNLTGKKPDASLDSKDNVASGNPSTVSNVEKDNADAIIKFDKSPTNEPNPEQLQESPRRRWGLLRGRSNNDDEVNVDEPKSDSLSEAAETNQSKSSEIQADSSNDEDAVIENSVAVSNKPKSEELQESPRRRWGLLRGQSSGDEADDEGAEAKLQEEKQDSEGSDSESSGVKTLERKTMPSSEQHLNSAPDVVSPRRRWGLLRGRTSSCEEAEQKAESSPVEKAAPNKEELEGDTKEEPTPVNSVERQANRVAEDTSPPVQSGPGSALECLETKESDSSDRTEESKDGRESGPQLVSDQNEELRPKENSSPLRRLGLLKAQANSSEGHERVDERKSAPRVNSSDSGGSGGSDAHADKLNPTQDIGDSEQQSISPRRRWGLLGKRASVENENVDGKDIGSENVDLSKDRQETLEDRVSQSSHESCPRKQDSNTCTDTLSSAAQGLSEELVASKLNGTKSNFDEVGSFPNNESTSHHCQDCESEGKVSTSGVGSSQPPSLVFGGSISADVDSVDSLSDKDTGESSGGSFSHNNQERCPVEDSAGAASLGLNGETYSQCSGLTEAPISSGDKRLKHSPARDEMPLDGSRHFENGLAVDDNPEDLSNRSDGDDFNESETSRNESGAAKEASDDETGTNKGVSCESKGDADLESSGREVSEDSSERLLTDSKTPVEECKEVGSSEFSLSSQDSRDHENESTSINEQLERSINAIKDPSENDRSCRSEDQGDGYSDSEPESDRSSSSFKGSEGPSSSLEGATNTGDADTSDAAEGLLAEASIVEQNSDSLHRQSDSSREDSDRSSVVLSDEEDPSNRGSSESSIEDKSDSAVSDTMDGSQKNTSDHAEDPEQKHGSNHSTALTSWFGGQTEENDGSNGDEDSSEGYKSVLSWFGPAAEKPKENKEDCNDDAKPARPGMYNKETSDWLTASVMSLVTTQSTVNVKQDAAEKPKEEETKMEVPLSEKPAKPARPGMYNKETSGWLTSSVMSLVGQGDILDDSEESGTENQKDSGSSNGSNNDSDDEEEIAEVVAQKQAKSEAKTEVSSSEKPTRPGMYNKVAKPARPGMYNKETSGWLTSSVMSLVGHGDILDDSEESGTENQKDSGSSNGSNNDSDDEEEIAEVVAQKQAKSEGKTEVSSSEKPARPGMYNKVAKPARPGMYNKETSGWLTSSVMSLVGQGDILDDSEESGTENQKDSSSSNGSNNDSDDEEEIAEVVAQKQAKSEGKTEVSSSEKPARPGMYNKVAKPARPGMYNKETSGWLTSSVMSLVGHGDILDDSEESGTENQKDSGSSNSSDDPQAKSKAEPDASWSWFASNGEHAKPESSLSGTKDGDGDGETAGNNALSSESGHKPSEPQKKETIDSSDGSKQASFTIDEDEPPESSLRNEPNQPEDGGLDMANDSTPVVTMENLGLRRRLHRKGSRVNVYSGDDDDECSVASAMSMIPGRKKPTQEVTDDLEMHSSGTDLGQSQSSSVSANRDDRMVDSSTANKGYGDLAITKALEMREKEIETTQAQNSSRNSGNVAMASERTQQQLAQSDDLLANPIFGDDDEENLYLARKLTARQNSARSLMESGDDSSGSYGLDEETDSDESETNEGKIVVKEAPLLRLQNVTATTRSKIQPNSPQGKKGRWRRWFGRNRKEQAAQQVHMELESSESSASDNEPEHTELSNGVLDEEYPIKEASKLDETKEQEEEEEDEQKCISNPPEASVEERVGKDKEMDHEEDKEMDHEEDKEMDHEEDKEMDHEEDKSSTADVCTKQEVETANAEKKESKSANKRLFSPIKLTNRISRPSPKTPVAPDSPGSPVSPIRRSNLSGALQSPDKKSSPQKITPKKKKKKKNSLNALFEKNNARKISRHGDEVSVGTMNIMNRTKQSGRVVHMAALNHHTFDDQSVISALGGPSSASVIGSTGKRRPWTASLKNNNRKSGKKSGHDSDCNDDDDEEDLKKIDVLGKTEDLFSTHMIGDDYDDDDGGHLPVLAETIQECDSEEEDGESSEEEDNASSLNEFVREAEATKTIQEVVEPAIDFDEMWDDVSCDMSTAIEFDRSKRKKNREKERKRRKREKEKEQRDGTTKRLRLFEKHDKEKHGRKTKRSKLSEEFVEALRRVFDDESVNSLDSCSDSEESNSANNAGSDDCSCDSLYLLEGPEFDNEAASRGSDGSDGSNSGKQSVRSKFSRTSRTSKASRSSKKSQRDAISTTRSRSSQSTRKSNHTSRKTRRYRPKSKELDSSEMFMKEVAKLESPKVLTIHNLRQEMIDRRGTSVNLLRKEYTTFRNKSSERRNSEELEPVDFDILTSHANTLNFGESKIAEEEEQPDGLGATLSRWATAEGVSELDDLATIIDDPKPSNLFGVSSQGGNQGDNKVVPDTNDLNAFSSPSKTKAKLPRTATTQPSRRPARPRRPTERQVDSSEEETPDTMLFAATFNDAPLHSIQESSDDEDFGLLAGNHSDDDGVVEQTNFTFKMPKIGNMKKFVPKIPKRKNGHGGFKLSDNEW